jgi:predicted metal-dependent peptidase
MTPATRDDPAVIEQALKVFSEARATMACFRVPGVAKSATLFFTTLLLRLEPVPTWDTETFATDGRRLLFNPETLLRLPKDQLFGVFAHEVYHVAMAHHARRQGRDLGAWNVACDLAINPVIVQSGFRLPPGMLLPGYGPHADMPGGLSAEEYYDRIMRRNQQDEEQSQEQEQDADGGDQQEEGPDERQGDTGDEGPEDEEPRQGEGEGQEGEGEGTGEGEAEGGPSDVPGGRGDQAMPDPGKCGGVIDPPDPSPAAAKQEEARSQVAVAQAAQAAKSMGDMPAWLERLVEQALQPKEDWREVLREFVSRHARQDHSWSKPNRRYAQQGVVLPSLQGDELGDVIVTVDCSGSISQRDLDVFAGELQGILEVFDCSLVVLYHDIPVTHVQKWAPGDGPIKLKPHGGGGTSHRPVFEWIAQRGDVEAPDAPCVICFTDLETNFPDRAPALPVLWAVYGEENPYYRRPKPPFGRVVEIKGG